MASNVETAYRFLLGKGLTPAQAAGAVGGLTGESGPNLDPSARNPTSGAIGIGQWLGARAKGVKPGDFTGQLNHLWNELQGPERGALNQLRQAHTIDAATDAWVRGYERPSAGEIASSIGARKASARSIFNQYKGLQGGGSALMDAAGASVPSDSGSAGSQPQGTPQPTTGLTSVLSELIGAQSTPPPASLPAPPKFSAGPTTPTGYQAPASSGGPTVKQSAADLLDQIQTPGGDIPAAQTQDTSAPQVGPSADGTVSAGAGAGGGYPLGRPGKVIGVPYQGTHTLGNWQSDNAVDIAVPVGTPMVADDSGVVVKVRHHPQDGGRFAGDQITIQGAHGNSYFYAHGVASVKPGQKIRAGQVIGRSGSANGVAHLHFGVEKGDPRKLLGSK